MVCNSIIVKWKKFQSLDWGLVDIVWAFELLFWSQGEDKDCPKESQGQKQKVKIIDDSLFMIIHIHAYTPLLNHTKTFSDSHATKEPG